MLCLLPAKPCCWPSPFHFSRDIRDINPSWKQLRQCSGEVFQQSLRPYRDGLVLNPSEQDLGAVCGNLSGAIRAFPFLPVPGKFLVHRLCGVTILPRAGAALAKPALVFIPLVFTKHTSTDGAEKIFFFIFLSPWQTFLAHKAAVRACSLFRGSARRWRWHCSAPSLTSKTDVAGVARR